MFQKLLLALSLVYALHAEDIGLAKLFKNENSAGTMVIESLDGTQRYVYNDERAKTPLLPASTFKILHTLIALDQGVVREDSVISWDGIERDIKTWNQDQTLKSAFQSSCVWCYQLFTRSIGCEVYDMYLATLHYGNEKTGSKVERFWLDGNLRISTYEQIAFLKKIYSNDLPFLQEHLDLLKEIMIDSKSEHYIIRAKTGWATPEAGEHHGWYVGYVESLKGVYFFAINLPISSSDKLPLRKLMTLEALKQKGIIE